MSLNLKKGETLNLNKAAPSLSKLALGAGWDVAAGGPSIDLDLIAFGIGANGKATEDNFCFFNHKSAANGCIVSAGDNLTGEGEGDDETITVDLDKLDATIQKVLVAVTFYNAGSRDLGMVANAFVRAVDQTTGTELGKFEITSGISGKTIYFAEVSRSTEGWQFKAIGESSADDLDAAVAKHVG